MRLVPATLFLIALASPGVAFADMSGPLSGGGWMTWMGIDQLSDTLNGRNGGRPAGQATSEHPGIEETPAAPPSAATLQSLRFVPSPERRKQNLASLAQLGGPQLASMLSSGDFIERVGQEMAPVGLRVDDLADAYTVWWVNSWSAVHNDTSTPDRATAMAVKAQAARALLAGGKLGTASDAMKQQFAETLLIQAVLLEVGLQQAKGNPAALKVMADQANQEAKTLGLELGAMQLTPKGFVPLR